MIPDNHQRAVRKTKHKLRFGPWNVRTLIQKENLDNIEREIKSIEVKLVC